MLVPYRANHNYEPSLKVQTTNYANRIHDEHAILVTALPPPKKTHLKYLYNRTRVIAFT